VTDVAVTGSQQTLYKCIIGIFAAISFGSVCLVVILVRSRHAFSVRPFHSGICFYIASFAPYVLLKAVTVGRLLEAKTQEQQLTAGLMLNGTFMLFFWLGFGGKMGADSAMDAPDITAHERRKRKLADGERAPHVEAHAPDGADGVRAVQCRLHFTCWRV